MANKNFRNHKNCAKDWPGKKFRHSTNLLRWKDYIEQQ